MDQSIEIEGFALAGAVVRRAYNSGGKAVPSGTVLGPDQFLSIGYAIRRLFVRENRLTPIYVPADKAPLPIGTAHVLHRGGGRYDVIWGTQLNAEVLSKDEAEALAAQRAAQRE